MSRVVLVGVKRTNLNQLQSQAATIYKGLNRCLIDKGQQMLSAKTPMSTILEVLADTDSVHGEMVLHDS